MLAYRFMKRGRTSARGRELLAKLRPLGPIIQGSLHDALATCGRRGCSCTSGGKRHPVKRLSWSEGGRTRTLSIPSDLVEEVAEWVAEWKRVKALLKEIGHEQREFLRAIKRRRGPGRPRKHSSKRSS